MALVRAQGAYNLVTGVWPLVSMRSFEAVLGPKRDRWLVRTVGGLLVVVGLTQLSTPRDDAALRQARRLGMGAAATFLAVDVVYVAAGRLRWTYLLDAAAEAGWLIAWRRSRGRAAP
ncbi:hypothetical protein [Jiangella anatolica]|uniref:hypothetical protein n=1 Tax=Jiangella anatolica TaxID=2670374 RepID=UPI0018F6E9DD|nr:hypothetical protein [Jiangella anatolica]